MHAKSKNLGHSCLAGKSAGGFNGRDPGETAARQLAYYKKVYAEALQLIENGGALKGVLFWRWAATDPTIVLGTPEQAATIGEPDIVSPSYRLEGQNGLGGRSVVCNIPPRRRMYHARSPVCHVAVLVTAACPR
jgi:hypothetical protein